VEIQELRSKQSSCLFENCISWAALEELGPFTHGVGDKATHSSQYGHNSIKEKRYGPVIILTDRMAKSSLK